MGLVEVGSCTWYSALPGRYCVCPVQSLFSLLALLCFDIFLLLLGMINQRLKAGDGQLTGRGNRSGICRNTLLTLKNVVGGRSTRVITCAHRNYYELLGVDVNAGEDEIKAAFRRKAKELHPDVNKDDSAVAVFMECNTAYETLSDADRRREYDAVNRIRRMNFFQDVEEASSVFERARVHERYERRSRHQQRDTPYEDGIPVDQSEFLERLARYMGSWPDAPLNTWQKGRIDPWGTSSSDAWYRKAVEQSQNPFHRNSYNERAYGNGGGGDSEWDYGRKRTEEWDYHRPDGWTSPGRGSEWSHPSRVWDEEDQNRGKRPDDGRFRRSF